MRRNLERSYVSLLNDLLNPTARISTMKVDNNEVTLYLLQHLSKIEGYLKAQQASGINALHYQDLQERIQLIRDRRNNPNPRN